jgi:hypothetical protein
MRTAVRSYAEFFEGFEVGEDSCEKSRVFMVGESKLLSCLLYDGRDLL